ncbi:MAG: right-handed parallel beta-helix repeat-containing protein [Deltaproteobacteria bacterium]|nr:right-handed parallel beta-helix repeat-containing protein [Deltaproteobacteria bacterium]
MRIVLASLALLLAMAAPTPAADYFVKNGGTDAADGLSLASAWATLGHAASVVNPGDVVHVQDGSYQEFYLDRSGTTAQPITFVADGAAVQITADNGMTPDGINVEGADHVVIDGFIVNDRTRAGIRVAVASFVTVRNCHTGHNGRWGIFSGHAYDFTIEDNEAHDSVAEHGIYVSNSGDRPIIRGNVVHDNHANGIHMNGDLSQGEDGIISNALVERNVIYGNGVGGGSGINMDGVTDSVVQNNLLYDNHASGISLYMIDGATGSTNNLVVNNTIVNAADGRWCVNINNGSTGNHVLNNILYDFHPFRGVITIDDSSRTGFVSDYNSVMSRFSIDAGDTVISLAAWQALGYDAHSFLATPADLFVTPGSDFHLSPTSPAIDAGTAASAPANDLEDAPRPVGAGVDLGAYERQLDHCGDGSIDSGEQCGEPGLTCGDPCTHCSGCTCIANALVCGDALVCGNEQCEVDGDCAPGEACNACACVNAPACASGITIAKPGLGLRAMPFALRTSGQAVVPKPWQGVDPVANGVRVVVDAIAGAGGLDVTIPGGAIVNYVGWSLNRAGTTWTYRDRAGTHGGVTKVVVKNRPARTDGLLSWSITGKSASALVLPDVSAVRSTVVLGSAAECASLAWNPPGAPRPRCQGTPAKLACR